MKYLDQFLDSPLIRRLAVILGIFGGILRFAATLLPSQIGIQITSILLVIVLFYISIIILRVIWLKEQRHYKYQAKRYGAGYKNFDVQCYDSTEKTIGPRKSKLTLLKRGKV